MFSRLLLRMGVMTLLLGSMVPLAAQQEVTSGPWTARLGSTGPDLLRYKGEPIAQRVGLDGYLPAWKGSRFNMAGAERAVAATGATWRKAVPGNQDAALSLEMDARRLALTLETEITAAGPTEFSLQLVPEAVCANPDQCVVWVNGALQVLPLDGTFEKLGALRELRFERPDRRLTVRCAGFELQDRRARGGGLYLVQVLGSEGGQKRVARSSIELQVEEFPASEAAGRAALLAQRSLEYRPLSFPNPGFEAEKPLDAWSFNPFAAPDEAIKHSGRRSARLTITEDVKERGHVYLVQNVPVEEGKLYEASAWIRAEKVESAAMGGMHSTGATIIIEFADKNGKWLAPGSYAKGIYGTADWRPVSTEAVRAPEGAGFATIFLALRARGTAWFDDVAVREVKRNVVLFSPLPGAEVADNTPAFQWQVDWRASATLELCRNESFAPGEVIRVEGIQSAPAVVEKPLAPGKWFWRVAVPEVRLVSPTWHFQQTAPLSRDTTEPRIDPTHAFLPGKNDPLRVRYSDNVGVTRVKLFVDGRDVSAQVKVGKTEATYAPKSGWSEGLHKVLAQVSDAAGNSVERTLFFTHAGRLPRTVWRQFGGVETDGVRRFPFGMYGVRVEDMPAVAAGGFDFVHSYRWDGDGSNESAIEYLDAARKHGLQAFIGINRRHLINGNEEFVAERVGALMRHPALLAWYLFDEPDLRHQYVSPQLLQRHYRLIKALDPFHPVVVTCAMDPAVPEYRDAMDVHWTQVYGTTAHVAARIEKHRKDLRPQTPVAAILHCYDRLQSGQQEQGGAPDLSKFQPDARLLRANAYMALVHNSSALLWWWWGEGSPRFLTVSRVPEAWSGLTETLTQIKTLRPHLTAEGPTATWVEKPAEGVEVHFWEKTVGGRTLIIAVNRDDKACEAAIAPRRAGLGKLRVLFEQRELPLAAGRASDAFAPLAVHVYEAVR